MSEAVASHVVAVEEHFMTEQYWQRTSGSRAFEGEGDELAWTQAIMSNESMHKRLIDFRVRLAEMDNAGVDLSVLSLNPPGVQLWSDAALATSLAREMNDELSELIRQSPSRLAGLAAVAPQDPDAAAAEITRSVQVLGLNGVLIASHTGGAYLDEAKNEPILAALEHVGATLYLHPRMPSPQMLDPFKPYGLEQALWGFQAEAATHVLRLIMSGALDRHPDLKIVLGHLGEGIPFWLWRLDNLHEKMFAWGREQLGMIKLDLRPSEYFLRNFSITTSGMFDPLVLDYCLHKVGAERILFAIDYPYESSEVATAFLREATLTAPQRTLICSTNAQRLFKL